HSSILRTARSCLCITSIQSGASTGRIGTEKFFDRFKCNPVAKALRAADENGCLMGEPLFAYHFRLALSAIGNIALALSHSALAVAKPGVINLPGAAPDRPLEGTGGPETS